MGVGKILKNLIHSQPSLLWMMILWLPKWKLLKQEGNWYIYAAIGDKSLSIECHVEYQQNISCHNHMTLKFEKNFWKKNRNVIKNPKIPIDFFSKIFKTSFEKKNLRNFRQKNILKISRKKFRYTRRWKILNKLASMLHKKIQWRR